MRTRLTSAVALAALALLAAGCSGDGPDDIPPDAVAVVDGDVISRTDLDEMLKRAKSQYKSAKQQFPKAGTTEYQSLQSQAVALLVQRVQFAQEADRRGLEVTEAEIDARAKEIEQEYFGGDHAALLKQLKAQGYTEEAFRSDVRAEVLQTELSTDLTKDAAVTDADIEAHYAANEAQYTVPASRTVRHILAKTKELADEIVRKLEQGGDFAALAKEYSEDPGSKDSGGELTIKIGETVPPFEKASFALDKGGRSAPVKTDYGWHVIEAVSAVTPKKVTPLAEAKEAIRSQLLEERKQTAVTDWTSGLAKEYDGKIEYATGYAPPETGSGDETDG